MLKKYKRCRWAATRLARPACARRRARAMMAAGVAAVAVAQVNAIMHTPGRGLIGEGAAIAEVLTRTREAIARRLLGEQGARDCARRLGAPQLLILVELRRSEFLAALDLIERNFLKGKK